MVKRNDPYSLVDKPYRKWTRGDYDHAEDSEQQAYDAWWRAEQETRADQKAERELDKAAALAARTSRRR